MQAKRVHLLLVLVAGGALVLTSGCAGGQIKKDDTRGDNGASKPGDKKPDTKVTTPEAPKDVPKVKQVIEGPFGEAIAIANNPAALAAQGKKARAKFEEAAKDPKLFAHCWYNIGLIDYRMGNLAGAESAWKKTLQKDANYLAAAARLAALEYDSGKHGTAAAKLEQIIAKERFQPEARNKLAEISLVKKDYDKAIQHARNVLLGNPDNLNAYLNLAISFYRKGLVDQAWLIVNNALQRKPKAAALANMMGLIYLKKDDAKRATDFFLRALANDPTLDDARLNLATLELAYGDFQKAADRFDKVLVKRPNDAMLHLSRGVAARGLEDYDRAKTEYMKSLQLDPALADAEYNLCVLHQQYTSEYETALQRCTAYSKRLNRKHPKYREMKKRLKSIRAAIEAEREAKAYEEANKNAPE